MTSVLGRDIGRAEQRALSTAARAMDAALERTRTRTAYALDEVHLALRRFEMRNDPDRDDWLRAVRAQVADGSIWDRVASQPDVRTILDRYRAGPG